MGIGHPPLPHPAAARRSEVSAARKAPRYAVIYDGTCPVCRKWTARLARWDTASALEMIASQDPAVAARFPWITAAALGESVHVVRLADGATWRGAAAVEELLKILPRGGSVAWLFRLPYARGLAELVYRIVARNRYAPGCGEHCRTT